MDPALAALVGVAVGGLLTFAVEAYRAHVVREQRGADLRRSAYTRLLAASARLGHEATMVARRVADEFGGTETPPLDPGRWPDGLARQSAWRFEEISDDLTLVYEEIRLLASADVVRPAGELMDALGLLGTAARSGGGQNDEEFAQARRRVHETRSVLREAMKNDVGRAA